MGLYAITWLATGVAKASRSRYSRAEQAKARVIKRSGTDNCGTAHAQQSFEGRYIERLSAQCTRTQSGQLGKLTSTCPLIGSKRGRTNLSRHYSERHIAAFLGRQALWGASPTCFNGHADALIFVNVFRTLRGNDAKGLRLDPKFEKLGGAAHGFGPSHMLF